MYNIVWFNLQIVPIADSAPSQMVLYVGYTKIIANNINVCERLISSYYLADLDLHQVMIGVGIVLWRARVILPESQLLFAISVILVFCNLFGLPEKSLSSFGNKQPFFLAALSNL